MRTFIKDGLVVQATGKEPFRDGVVAIDDGRIAAVGQAAEFPLDLLSPVPAPQVRAGQAGSPVRAEVVDAAGCMVLPGLIDCHVYAFAYPQVTGFSESEAAVWATNYLRVVGLRIASPR